MWIGVCHLIFCCCTVALLSQFEKLHSLFDHRIKIHYTTYTMPPKQKKTIQHSHKLLISKQKLSSTQDKHFLYELPIEIFDKIYYIEVYMENGSFFDLSKLLSNNEEVA